MCAMKVIYENIKCNRCKEIAGCVLETKTKNGTENVCELCIDKGLTRAVEVKAKPQGPPPEGFGHILDRFGGN